MRINLVNAIKNNNKNYDHIDGIRFYYYKKTALLSIFLLSIAIFFIIYIMIKSNNIEYYCFVLLSLLFFLLCRVVYMPFYKNPVFIINKNLVYYTLNDKMYDLSICRVYKSLSRGFFFSGELNIINKEDNISISNWYIDGDADLDKLLKPYYSISN
jgi:hypothetical protein